VATSSPSEARSGYAMDGMPYDFTLVFVRASISAVCEWLKPYFQPVAGRPPTGIESVIFQFDGSEWTGFLFDVGLLEDIKKLSSYLCADCILLIHDDTSSWTAFNVLHSGNLVEEYEFGFVDAEDRSHFPSGWDTVASDANGNQFLFRSSLRRSTETELKNDKAFLHQAFRSHKLWCPDWNTISKLSKLPGVQQLERTIYW
jgi:hypothetical protein